VFSSAKETAHQVVANVELVSFTLVDVIMKVPERPSLPVKLLVELVNTFAFFVLVVHKECLERVQIEGRWWEGLDVVLHLFGFLLLFLWSSCRFGLLLFLWFHWIGEADRLHGLCAHLDATKRGDEGGIAEDSGHPGLHVLDRLSLVDFIEGLERLDKGCGHDDVGESHLIADEELGLLKARVEEGLLLLQLGRALFPVSALDLRVLLAEDTSGDLSDQGGEGAGGPVDPLVNFGLSLRGVAQQFLGNSSHVLDDWDNASEAAVLGLEKWIFAEWVLGLDFLGFGVYLDDAEIESC